MNEKEDAVEIVSRLHKAFQLPYLFDNQKIVATSSMGIAVFPQDGMNSKILIPRSDEALYQAKEHRNLYNFMKLR